MDSLDAVFKRARSARELAHVPYSGFRVGAALQLADRGEIISGCNVENASYGATVCAERIAVFTAVASVGTERIRGDGIKSGVSCLVVVTDATPPAVPCALCLQVLQEFCPASLPIHLADLTGIRRSFTLGDLLPIPFSSFTS